MAKKISKFNSFLPVKTKTGDNLLFNSLTKASFFIDDELKEILEESDLDKLDDEIIAPLMANGIIVDANIEEERMFNIIHNRVKYDTRVSSFLVLPTFRCNCRCYYCYEGAGEIFTKVMDESTINNVIEFIKKQTTSNKSNRVIVGLYGGEPLLFPDIDIKIASAIKTWAAGQGIEFYSTITTNGTLINDQIINDLLLPYVSSIHFTFEGSTKEIHDQIRKKKAGGGSFEAIINAITKLKPHHDKHLTFRIHFGHINDEEEDLRRIGKLLDLFDQLGLKERPNCHMYFVQIEPSDACLSSTVDKEYMSRKERGRLLMLRIWDLVEQKGWKNKLDIELGAEHSMVQYNTVPCEYLKATNYVIDPAGDVYMCPTSAGHIEHRVGKVLTGGVFEPNSKYHEILTRNPTILEGCKDCEFLPICAGSCPITAFDATNSYSKPWCSTTKSTIRKSLVLQFKNRYPDRF